MLSADDRWAISETVSLHGHLFDEGQLDRLDELFTADVVYDLTDVGLEPLHGIDEIRRATLELGEPTRWRTTSRTSSSPAWMEIWSVPAARPSWSRPTALAEVPPTWTRFAAKAADGVCTTAPYWLDEPR